MLLAAVAAAAVVVAQGPQGEDVDVDVLTVEDTLVVQVEGSVQNKAES